MLRASDGGYDSEIGWSPTAKKPVTSIVREMEPIDANDADPHVKSDWQSLDDHTQHVVDALEEILRELPPIDASLFQNLSLAARWHDAGKGTSRLSKSHDEP